MRENEKYVQEAFRYYADRVRQDGSNAYFCYRLWSESFRGPQAPDLPELLKTAAKTLLQEDPYFILTVVPLHLTLSPEELQEAANGISLPDKDLENMVKGAIYHRAGYPRDEGPLRRAIDYLLQVSPTGQDLKYFDLLADCYRWVDYDRYVQVFPSLIERIDPRRRSFELLQMLEAAGQRGDWATYDRYRQDVESLPVGAHFCECYHTTVANLDGLRELSRGNRDAVAALLEKAANVSGCPHSNAGGLRMILVEALVEQELFPAECLAYLDRSDQFHPSKRAAELRARIQPDQAQTT